MKKLANYLKKIILIELSYNLLIYLFFQGRLKIKKFSIRAFFLNMKSYFISMRKVMSFLQ